MQNWFELEPGEHAINVGQTWRVEVKNKKVAYYSPSNDKEEIDYGSNAAAQAAYDAFIAATSLVPAGGLVVGDLISVSHHTHARGALGERFTAILVAFPSVAFPLWVVLADNQVMYVDNVTVSKQT